MASKAANDNDTGEAKTGTTSTKPKSKSKPRKKTNTVPTPLVELVENTNQIQFAILDKGKLLWNEPARTALEENPLFMGMVDAEDPKCREFLNDNDLRFTEKEAA